MGTRFRGGPADRACRVTWGDPHRAGGTTFETGRTAGAGPGNRVLFFGGQNHGVLWNRNFGRQTV
jgi:hypothetical protein